MVGNGAAVGSVVSTPIVCSTDVGNVDGSGLVVDNLTKLNRLDPLHRLNPKSLKIAIQVEP